MRYHRAMCGIAGALVYESCGGAPPLLVDAVATSRQRGEDSFGVVAWRAGQGWRELRSPSPMDLWWTEFAGEGGVPQFFLHTSRAEPTTEFQSFKTATDVPPFRAGGIAVAHNGIISNDAELARAFNIQRSSRIDTAILPGLIAKIGFWRALGYLRGGSALGVIDAEERRLYLARNFLPLTIVWLPGMVLFASEAAFFPGSEEPFPPYRRWDLPPFTAIEFSPDGYRGPVRWGDSPDNAERHAWPSH